MTGAALAAPLLCASGFAALVYELVWIREFGFLLGNATATLSAVLAAYMTGLAAGSRLAGGMAARLRRPLRAWAWLELGIGASGLLVFALLGQLHDRLGPVGGTDPTGPAAVAVRYVVAAMVLLVPTALMGATLPVLGRWLDAGAERSGGVIGRLYAINTLGGAAGAFATGFVLIRNLGVERTNLLAVGLNGVVGITALLIDRLQDHAEPGTVGVGSASGSGAVPVSPPPASGTSSPFLLFFCFSSGALALSAELVHARLLGWLVGNRVTASAVMLTVYLIGIAAGAWIAGRLADRWRSDEAVYSRAQILAGLGMIGGAYWFPDLLALARGLEARIGADAPWRLAGLKALEAAALLGLPAAASGAAFPSVVRAMRREDDGLGAAAGRAYALNTVGCIAGSLACGFWLIPAAGAYRAAVLVGVAAILLGYRGFAGSWAAAGAFHRAASAAAAVALAGWLGARALAADRYPWPRAGLTLVSAAEEPAALVTVWRGPLGWYLFGDDTELSFPLGSTSAAEVQRRQAWLPLLLHPAPRRALVIGLGFGVTSGTLSRFGDCESVETVELLRGVVGAASRFSAENFDPAVAPGARVVAGDGRYALRHAAAPWDLIVSNVTGPDLPGSAACYTREYFALARGRLAPDGVFLVHAYGPDAPVILRTLASVFPHVAGFRAYRHSTFLLAADHPVVPDAAALAARISALPARTRARLERDGLGAPAAILARLVLTEAAARAAGTDPRVPVNSDRSPVLEYRMRADGRSWFESRM